MLLWSLKSVSIPSRAELQKFTGMKFIFVGIEVRPGSEPVSATLRAPRLSAPFQPLRSRDCVYGDCHASVGRDRGGCGR